MLKKKVVKRIINGKHAYYKSNIRLAVKNKEKVEYTPEETNNEIQEVVEEKPIKKVKKTKNIDLENNEINAE